MTIHTLMIVDASGSMTPFRQDTIGGFNGYIDELAKDTANKYTVTAVLFANPTFFRVHAAGIEVHGGLIGAAKLDEVSYTPMGMTALLDATGKAITEFEQVVQLAEGDKVVVVSITDGEENASREYSFEAIASLIEDRKAKGWEFVFLAQGFDGWQQASRMGYAARDYGGTRTMHTNSVTGTYRAAAATTRGMASGMSVPVADWMGQEVGADEVRSAFDATDKPTEADKEKFLKDAAERNKAALRRLADS